LDLHVGKTHAPDATTSSFQKPRSRKFSPLRSKTRLRLTTGILYGVRELNLQEAYDVRPIRFLELWHESGWTLKVYGIAYGRERPREELVEAAKGSSGLLALFPGMVGAQGTVGETALNVMVVGRGGCKEGEPAIGNNSCRANQCGDRDGLCFCATTVDGRKRCVNLRDAVCPKRDECDRNRDCPGDRICIRSAGCCGHLRRNDCVKPC
jgi:hypothetical protein